MDLEEFNAQMKKKINPEGFLFSITCVKCGSDFVLIENGLTDYAMGSEYTGMYDVETTAVIKCLACGNAFSIVNNR